MQHAASLWICKKKKKQLLCQWMIDNQLASTFNELGCKVPRCWAIPAGACDSISFHSGSSVTLRYVLRSFSYMFRLLARTFKGGLMMSSRRKGMWYLRGTVSCRVQEEEEATMGEVGSTTHRARPHPPSFVHSFNRLDSPSSPPLSIS